MCRSLVSLCAVALVVGLIATPAASAQHSLNLYVGGFEPRPVDSRGTADVLSGDDGFLNPVDPSGGAITRQFNHLTIGGEWLADLGRYLEAGFGVGFYRRTVPTVNSAVTNEDGTNLSQELTLQIVPFTGTIRFLPLGHDDSFQPYFGTGIGLLVWRYTEAGQFVDDQNIIFNADRAGSGGSVGPLVFAGVRFPVGRLRLGGEFRYQWADGTLPPDQGFAGTKIDLRGFSYLLMINIPF
jgi:hypothetical protein